MRLRLLGLTITLALGILLAPPAAPLASFAQQQGGERPGCGGGELARELGRAAP